MNDTLKKSQVIKWPLEHYISMLRHRHPFSFSRWGDGEWYAVLGETGFYNADEVLFSDELAEDLRTVLASNLPYHHAITNIVFQKGFQVPDFGYTWFDGDVILNACLAGELLPFIEVVRSFRVLYVGNFRLRQVDRFFPYKAYLEVSATDAYSDRLKIRDEIVRLMDKHTIDFIGYSAGPVSKILIDEIYTWRGNEVTQIDFGSTFDGFFRPMPNTHPLGSRKYIRKGNYNWQELLQLNAGLEVV